MMIYCIDQWLHSISIYKDLCIDHLGLNVDVEGAE